MNTKPYDAVLTCIAKSNDTLLADTSTGEVVSDAGQGRQSTSSMQQHTLIAPMVGLLMALASNFAHPQTGYTGVAPTPQAGEAALPDSELKARYQNCPLGNYAGHRPGKVRYAKDRYLWAVTPAFAKTYCMPEQFVSEELKGAEAVAFRLVPGGFGENCGFGGKTEVCSQGVDLRFEIYISREVKLPVKNEVTAFNCVKNTSKLLISSTNESDRLRKQIMPNGEDRPGCVPRFERNAFGLAGIQGDKVVWPLTALYLEEYLSNMLTGSIDYIALQGSTGNFKNARMKKLNIREFAVLMDRPGDKRPIKEVPLEEFALVIRLPIAMSDQIQAMDNARGDDWEALGKRALVPQSNTKPSLTAPR